MFKKIMTAFLFFVCCEGLAVTSHAADTTATATTTAQWTNPPRWKPGPYQRWQIQFSGPINTSLNVDVFDLDLDATSADTIKMLHAQGKKVICYVSVGTWEEWRADAASFPQWTLAGANGDWPGEYWLDIRKVDALSVIMGKRFDIAKAKGCDGIDADNMDGYTNNIGVPVTGTHQLTYNKAIARLAHERGLAIGLKNDGWQMAKLVNYFDYVINESCFYYNECKLTQPFVDAKKPVFLIEYLVPASQFCRTANESNYNAIQKNRNLDAWVVNCR